MADKITPHFTWSEATHSRTAQLKGLDNNPSTAIQGNIEVTAECLEGVRSLLGVPLKITSWYRTPEVNAAVGGSKTSDHQTGYAVDFRPVGMDALKAARMIEEARTPRKDAIWFDQLIWYPVQDRLHISFAPAMRRECLTKTAGGYREGFHAQ